MASMPTLNERAWKLCDAMVADAEGLGIAIHTVDCGTRLIDCGVKVSGSIEAGRRLAEICMAGLAEVTVVEADSAVWSGSTIRVYTREPVAACMASQYAGWEVKEEQFFAMGSGPMRAAAGREDLFDDIGNRERPNVCVGVLETSKLPPDVVCVDIAEKCGVAADRLTLLTARTASFAGTVQIVARSLETTLHKLHVLGFDLNRITLGSGEAPLPPIADNDLKAIGWTNDAILYGAAVVLLIRDRFDDRNEIGPRVPSNASPDYGRPFSEIFAQFDHDFYRIDPMLFSPAKVAFFCCNDPGGPAFQFGRLAPDVLAESFAKK